MKNQIELFLMAAKECGYTTIKQVERNLDKIHYLVDVLSKKSTWEIHEIQHMSNIITAAQIISKKSGIKVNALIDWANTHDIDLAYSGHVLCAKENRMTLLVDVLSDSCEIKELIK